MDVAFYADLDTDLQRLLLDLLVVMSVREQEDVLEYIGHAEYGLALDTLCHVLDEERIGPSPDQLGRIRRLAARIGLDLSWWSPAEPSADA